MAGGMVKANRFHHTFRRGQTMGTGVRGGLEDIVVSTSDICFIDGKEGRLVYRGYDVNDLVEHSSFEEVIFLLWHGGLPSKKELEAHTKALSATANRKLPPGIVSLLKALPKKTTPMEVLRTGVSALSAYDPDAGDNSKDATARKALRLTAQMPTLVAAWDRIRKGKAPVAPNPKLNLAANFLYMLSGKKASPLAVKTFDVALILHADHEFNASTFAARVTAATMSDLHSAIVSAIGALKGPLHGGANEQVMLMVQKIKTPANAEAWIRKTLADHGRVMGFGHRVYRLEDPRAKHPGPPHATYVPIDRRWRGCARSAARQPRDGRVQWARAHAGLPREPAHHHRALSPGRRRQRLERRHAGASRSFPVPVPADRGPEREQRQRDRGPQSRLAADRHRVRLPDPQRHRDGRAGVALAASGRACRARRRPRRTLRRQALAGQRPAGGADDRPQP